MIVFYAINIALKFLQSFTWVLFVAFNSNLDGEAPVAETFILNVQLGVGPLAVWCPVSATH